MLIPIHRVTFCAHCYTWREALCSFLYMECSFMLIALQGVKLYTHCYTRSEDFMLINLHEVKMYAHCNTACEA